MHYQLTAYHSPARVRTRMVLSFDHPLYPLLIRLSTHQRSLRRVPHKQADKSAAVTKYGDRQEGAFVHLPGGGAITAKQPGVHIAHLFPEHLLYSRWYMLDFNRALAFDAVDTSPAVSRNKKSRTFLIGWFGDW